MSISVWYVVYKFEVAFPNTWSSARALGPAIDVANFDDTKFYLFWFLTQKRCRANQQRTNLPDFKDMYYHIDNTFESQLTGEI